VHGEACSVAVYLTQLGLRDWPLAEAPGSAEAQEAPGRAAVWLASWTRWTGCLAGQQAVASMPQAGLPPASTAVSAAVYGAPGLAAARGGAGAPGRAAGRAGDPDATVITISGPSHDNLLLQLTGAFNVLELTVASASIQADEDGGVLDVFRVTNRADEKARAIELG